MLTDVNMLLMLKKSISGGMGHAIHWYAKANKKYRKDYEKKKELSLLGCYQLWIINVKKVACGWFQMEKRQG